ncbi:unnamed protein product [Kluyveromyces dobzhanskii CBS 2104]|uniref:Cytochrome c oxidase-assembly factor COX23, mitochondrial n=1 Tax=Kluyveromyces dobzhanskii CBS 2104 TaxID=1427455 RepID=A0A0A8LBZ1_9SACH|nr:unnamed protein product [Kluyveromyces dobzhanskii CBS 2104]
MSDKQETPQSVEKPKQVEKVEENVDPSLELNKSKVNFTPEKTDVNTYKFYPDNPESTLNRYRFASKGASQYYDPCQESSKMSFKCLERNNYDRDLCHDYFDAYRECKKQWLKARREKREFWE